MSDSQSADGLHRSRLPASAGFYDRQYHTARHARLIGEDKYFYSRAEASVRLYFDASERSRRIFEYGCGIGQGIACLPNAAGWDVSSQAREACRRRRIPVFENLQAVPKGVWDVVFCRHVLEHLEDPLESLRRMRDLVAPGGQILLVLPKEKYRKSSLEPDVNQHLYCWNFRSVNNLLIRAGYKPESNKITYILGYRALLPVRRILGLGGYLFAARTVGWFLRNGELLVRARPVATQLNDTPSVVSRPTPI